MATSQAGTVRAADSEAVMRARWLLDAASGDEELLADLLIILRRMVLGPLDERLLLSTLAVEAAQAVVM